MIVLQITCPPNVSHLRRGKHLNQILGFLEEPIEAIGPTAGYLFHSLSFRMLNDTRDLDAPGLCCPLPSYFLAISPRCQRKAYRV